MPRIVLKYGLSAGAILCAMMLLTFPFMEEIGFDRGIVIGYSTMVIAFLAIYLGIRACRDRVEGGSIGFGRALAVGLLITLVASVCYVATWQLVYHRLKPDFLDRYAAHAVDKARQAGAAEAQIAATRRDLEELKALYRDPLRNIGMTLLEPLPVGLVFSLVSAGVLSRRRPSAAGVPGGLG
jgi:hypothetical protein